jgi:hypothetical protein
VDDFLTYTWLREDAWEGHTFRMEVRRAIQDYGDESDFKVFSLGVVPQTGSVFYLEVPRSEWTDMFGVAG